MKKLFSLALLIVFTSVTAFTQVSLKYDLKEGTYYDTKSEMNQKISQTIMGQTQEISNLQGAGVNMTVLSVNDGSYEVKLTYTSMRIYQPMAQVDYDSEKPSSSPNPMTKSFDAVIGEGFTFTLTEKGEVSNIQGIDAMLDNMATKMEITDQAQLQALKAQLSSQYNDESALAQVQQSIMKFPANAVSIGDTWSEDESIQAPLPMKILTSYEVAAMNGEAITINVSSEVFTEGEEMNMSGATMTPDLSGIQSGTLTVDRATGLVLSSTMDQMISGAMMMTSPQEMEIPMEISGEVTVSGTIN